MCRLGIHQHFIGGKGKCDLHQLSSSHCFCHHLCLSLRNIHIASPYYITCNKTTHITFIGISEQTSKLIAHCFLQFIRTKIYFQLLFFSSRGKGFCFSWVVSMLGQCLFKFFLLVDENIHQDMLKFAENNLIRCFADNY